MKTRILCVAAFCLLLGTANAQLGGTLGTVPGELKFSVSKNYDVVEIKNGSFSGTPGAPQLPQMALVEAVIARLQLPVPHSGKCS